MPVHPAVQDLLSAINAMPPPNTEGQSVTEQRAVANESMMQMFIALAEPPIDIAEVCDHVVDGPYGQIPVRIYRNEEGVLPCYVNIHGGAWWLGDLDQMDGICRLIATHAQCVVVSVDYRLAPEHKFPIPLEECYYVTQWCAANPPELNIDVAKIAVGGSSAGGNLAAGVTLLARDRGGPAIMFQWLDIPATDSRMSTPSYTDNGEGYFLTTEGMQQGWDFYCDEEDKSNPYASPMHADDLLGLPPAFISTMEYDPLRDEGEAYGQRLQAAGVACEIKRYDGMIHGSLMLTAAVPEAKQAVLDICARLHSAYQHS